jgi:hypothetical protein
VQCPDIAQRLPHLSGRCMDLDFFLDRGHAAILRRVTDIFTRP